jgi:predicted RNA-binding protein Jag
MTTFLFSNNAATTLAGPIAANATTLNLAAGTGALFPNPASGQQFSLTLVSQTDAAQIEVVYCTARSTDTCTVVRGQEGTPTASFLAGDFASNDLTAGATAAFTQASQLQIDAPNYAVDSGSVNAMVATLSPLPASLASITGAAIRIKVSHTNTGSVTLNLTGAGTAIVVSQTGANLTAGQILAGAIYTFVYNGSSFQLLEAQLQINASNYAVDSGSVNAIVATLSPLPSSLANIIGATILVKVANTNTGGVTLNLTGAGTATVVSQTGAGLTAGQILAGSIYAFVYNGSAFQLLNAQLQINASNYAVDSGSVNAIVATLSPLPSGFANIMGATFLVKAANTNTGAVTLNLTGAGTATVVSQNGSGLTAGQILTGAIYAFVYDGAVFQLLDAPISHGIVMVQSSGSFTVPAGVTSGFLELWGAGGGGGGGASTSTASAGSGGGGGGYVKAVLSVTPGQTITTTIGAAGAGGAAGGSGGAGGTTSVLSFTAVGGAGGVFQSVNATSQTGGGSASGGSLNLQGGSGGIVLPGVNATSAVGGSGGDGAGAGGQGGVASSASASPGTFPGGGGGGGGGPGGFPGGAGAAGLVVFTW